MLGAGDSKANEDLPEQSATHVEDARATFHTSLNDGTTFWILVTNAWLSIHDAELFAVAAAAEIDSSCEQLLAEVQGSPGRNRMTLGSISRLLGPSHPGALCASPDAPLRRASVWTRSITSAGMGRGVQRLRLIWRPEVRLRK